MTLEGRVALVTGASRGIGRAIALRLARDGVAVAVNYVSNKEAARSVVAAIEEAGGRAVAMQGDVADPEQAGVIVAGAVEAFGRLDILVNNAGRIAFTLLGGTEVADFDALFATNVRGIFFLTQAAAAVIADYGRVVSLSSIVSRMRYPGASGYAASKAAVEAFTRSWSAELGPRGITVNSVSPGMVETDMMSATSTSEMRADYAARAPMGRIGQPEDIANTVAFLCSSEAAWITGQDFAVNGGAA